MTIVRFLFGVSLLLLVGVSAAQDSSVVDETSIYPIAGIRMSRIEATSIRGSVVGHIVDIDPSGMAGATGARLDAVLAADDPWRAHPIETIIERESANAGMSMIMPPIGSGTATMQGFVFLHNTIWSWPADGPVIVLGADGMTRLIELPEEASVAGINDEWTIPLGGINTAYVPGRPSLYCGPLSGSAPPLSEWPEGTLLLALEPSRTNTTPPSSIWDSSLPTMQRLWVPGDPLLAERAVIARGKWVLLIPPSMSEGDLSQLLQAEALRFHVPLGDEIPVSAFAVGVGTWFLRDSQLVASQDVDRTIRSLIAVDESDGRAWLASLASRSSDALNDNDVARLLIDRGATHAIELPQSRQRLAVRTDTLDWLPPPPATAARVALMAVNRPLELSFERGEKFRRLRFLVVDGTPSDQGRNPPRAISDGKIYVDPAANHYWSATFTPTSNPLARVDNPWLEMTLEPEAQLAVLDIYHAEGSGFSSHFNLRSYRILGRESSATDWQTLFDIRHDKPIARERLRLDPPRALSHLRVEVLDPGFLPGITTVRLSEIIAWGQVATDAERTNTR